jgi:hypothetical protein
LSSATGHRVIVPLGQTNGVARSWSSDWSASERALARDRTGITVFHDTQFLAASLASEGCRTTRRVFLWRCQRSVNKRL